MAMTYVYILWNVRTERPYIGFTTNLRERYATHKTRDSDWELVYYEAYASEADARQRERDLKQYGSAWGHLKRRIQRSLDFRKSGRSFELKPQ